MRRLFSSIWFRCISTLLIIVLISGGLLSVLNDLLYVSEEERTGRAIKKIYGVVENYNVVYDKSINELIENEFGTIDNIYEVQVSQENSYLLFKATGYKGYKGGTISLWVSILENSEGILSIAKVILAGDEKQTLMSKLTSDFYNNFNIVDVAKAYEMDQFFTTDANQTNANPVSGATKSATAANNAINCVITYLGENYEN